MKVTLEYRDGYFIGHENDEVEASLYTSSGTTARGFIELMTNMDSIMARLIVADMSLGYITDITFERQS